MSQQNDSTAAGDQARKVSGAPSEDPGWVPHGDDPPGGPTDPPGPPSPIQPVRPKAES
jgi:hypothetical protein